MFDNLLKVAIVGYGSIGKKHLKNLLKIQDFNVILCTKQPIKKKHPRLTILNSIDECINCQPEIVLITNETNLHIPTAIKFAKAGSHLLIEKPLSNSLENIRILSTITKQKKLKTIIGCNLRFHPCIIKMKQIIYEKKLGKIISVQSENSSFLPDWHPNEDYRKSYAALDSKGGGVVLTCIHEIDYLYWLFGDVSEVFSFTGKKSKLDISSDDSSSILLKFKNNIVAEIHLDFYQRPSQRTCKITGTEGTLLFNLKTNSLKFYDIKLKKWKTILKLENFKINSTYIDEVKYFLNCIQTNKKSFNDVEEGKNVLTIAMAILKSSKFGRLIKL